MSELGNRRFQSYCVFSANGEWFAMPTVHVRDVVASPSPTTVPRSSPMLAGLSHTGSEFLPMLQLSAGDRNSQMLVLDGPQGHWGLLVESVASVQMLECSTECCGQQDEWSAVVIGSSTFRNRPVRVLDAGRLYGLAAEMLQTYWAVEGLALTEST